MDYRSLCSPIVGKKQNNPSHCRVSRAGCSQTCRTTVASCTGLLGVGCLVPSTNSAAGHVQCLPDGPQQNRSSCQIHSSLSSFWYRLWYGVHFFPLLISNRKGSCLANNRRTVSQEMPKVVPLTGYEERGTESVLKGLWTCAFPFKVIGNIIRYNIWCGGFHLYINRRAVWYNWSVDLMRFGNLFLEKLCYFFLREISRDLVFFLISLWQKYCHLSICT